jgi:CheY-like chemotaxis protein
MPQRGRILVVDDEDVMRELIGSMLETEGYSVTTAAGGAQALEAIRSSRPDLVLLDLNMPGVSGWDVIKRLVDDPQPPPVVAMSGMRVDEPPELRRIGKCVHGYLPKPFGITELVRTCNRVLEATRRPVNPVGHERRREPRRNLLVPATLMSNEGTPAAMGQILNLSTGGAEFDIGATLQPGTELRLAFDIPGGHGPFQVVGRVQWRKEGRLGLQFLDLPEADRQRLRSLLGSPQGE